MRPLKFRYFDPVIKQFIYSDDFKWDNNYEQLEYFFAKAKGYAEEVEQWTGLKDKKGKDIYEGDIVQEHRYEDWGDKEGYDIMLAVGWSLFEHGWRFGTTDTYAGTKVQNNAQLVGNVHQNPELLQ